MGTGWRQLAIGILMLSLTACGSVGLNDRSSFPVSPELVQGQADSAASAPDDYIEQTIRTIADEAVLDHFQPLDDFLAFSRTNSQLEMPVKQQIAAGLLARLSDFRLTPSQQPRYRRELETVARGDFTVIPAPPGPRPLTFPRDDGAHRDLTEWWYYTGHLGASQGQRYGYELTFFRVLPAIFFAHVAVTDENTGRFAYSRNFFLPSRTAIAEDRLDVRYQDWGAKTTGPGRYRIWGNVEDFRFSLDLVSKRPQPLLVDSDGYIPFAFRSFTYYYSLTRLETRGELGAGGRTVPVQGVSWMDHQWGNFAPGWPLTVTGWNWFSIQLDDGTEYNLFELRPWNGRPSPLKEANIVRPDGSTEFHPDLQLQKLRTWQSPRTGKSYVMDWNLSIPATGEQFRITAVQDNQELARRRPYDIAPNYWEGNCRVIRTGPDGRSTEGVGYTEMVHALRDADLSNPQGGFPG